MSSIPRKIKVVVGEVEFVDVPTMRNMSEEEYEAFIQSNHGLMFVDGKHKVLRSLVADYPLATTREQLEAVS